ncbi:MAG: Holliday junction resolvase RuvX [Candidatus Cloacimonetes bacterium]|nr:Holliday junction resolvase RuvX [Candidatus Cloacimonadota bacterium]
MRVGLALSDPLQIISQPYKVIPNDESLFEKIREIVNSKNVGKIVLGLPLNLDGEDTFKTREVRKFAEILKKKINIPIILWDERYTTVEANEILKKMDYGIKESKDVIDKVAASIILKNYLDSNK